MNAPERVTRYTLIDVGDLHVAIGRAHVDEAEGLLADGVPAPRGRAPVRAT